MGGFILRRTLAGIITIFLISVVTFLIFFKMPTGDPAVRIAGKNPSPELLAAIRHKFHLDEPLPVQYVYTMKQLLTGQLRSFNIDDKVVPMAARAFPVTMSLCFVAAAMWLTVGLAIGIYSAKRPGSKSENVIMIAALVGTSMPIVFVCMVGIYLFTQLMPIFPPGDYLTLYRGGFLGWLYHLILPGMTIALTSAAIYAMITRTNVLATQKEEWVKTAIAKGVGPRQVFSRHVLRLALIPIVIMFGMDLSGLLAGAVFTESLFGLPGLGSLLMTGIKSMDFPILIMMTIFSCALIVIANTVVDIIQAIIDPRIRLG